MTTERDSDNSASGASRRRDAAAPTVATTQTAVSTRTAGSITRTTGGSDGASATQPAAVELTAMRAGAAEPREKPRVRPIQ
eukprot:9343608-Lingulodinium_polyedra.AAC.1